MNPYAIIAPALVIVAIGAAICIVGIIGAVTGRKREARSVELWRNGPWELPTIRNRPSREYLRGAFGQAQQ